MEMASFGLASFPGRMAADLLKQNYRELQDPDHKRNQEERERPFHRQIIPPHGCAYRYKDANDRSDEDESEGGAKEFALRVIGKGHSF